MQTKKVLLTGSGHGLLRNKFLNKMNRSFIDNQDLIVEEVRKKLLDEIKKQRLEKPQ